MSNEIILVVDDNKQIANYLGEKILPGLGYEARIAYDGKSMRAILHKEKISLMLLDFQLGETTGLALLREMTDEGINIPTILIVAQGSEQVAVDAFHIGVQDYLTKPVDDESLELVINRAFTNIRLKQERERLAAQLNEQISWLQVLSKIGQSVTSSLEVDEVLRRIVEAGVYLTHAEEGFISLIDEQTGELYLRAVKNIGQEESKLLNLPISDSVPGMVIRTKKPYRMAKTSEGPNLKVSTGFLVKSILYVPLLSKGKVLGVLSVDNRQNKRDFTQTDEDMLSSMADYASVAIDNANLYQCAQKEIEERSAVELALRKSEERYALAIQGANDGLWDWDLKSGQIYYSPRWKSMLGFDEDEISSNPNEWFNRIHPEDIDRVKRDISAHIKGLTAQFENEHRILHRDGNYRWVTTRGVAVRKNNDVLRMAGSQADITDRKLSEQRLLHDAFHDSLTGLPNRALFMDRLSVSIERCKRYENYLFAVLFMDLDHFKEINDNMGHVKGDQLLIEASKLIKSVLRPTDTIARIGGDEFVLLLEEISSINDATIVAERIQSVLINSLKFYSKKISISASIGIVMSTSAYQRSEDMLKDADIAMYRAKANGRAKYEIFDPTMRDKVLERQAMGIELQKALEKNEFQIYYQPIVSLQSGGIQSFEALIRWHHPVLGLLYPHEFINLARETGLIVALDKWVLREACHQMQQWQNELTSLPMIGINVNISANQMKQPDLVDHIKNILQETGLQPERLKLEISASSIVDGDYPKAELFAELRQVGVQIQIDDFGIGDTSLSFLSDLPINALKIDQSFISGPADHQVNSKIINAIIMLTHGLGMNVIAEGVETENQLSNLRTLGCEYGQGFLISVPLDRDQIRLMLERTVYEGETFAPWRSLKPSVRVN